MHGKRKTLNNMLIQRESGQFLASPWVIFSPLAFLPLLQPKASVTGKVSGYILIVIMTVTEFWLFRIPLFSFGA